MTRNLIINIPPQSRTISMVDDVYRLVATGEDTNGTYTFLEAIVCPGGGPPPHDHAFAYVEKEDTPRPLLFQLDLLRQVGFAQVEVLYKNVCFVALGAVKR
ncbi:MAG TPA: hypothetical protein VFA18_10345 [Gemmataceae bacterium]|nr:hypothetical protein [Gemmataceae bacterium]